MEATGFGLTVITAEAVETEAVASVTVTVYVVVEDGKTKTKGAYSENFPENKGGSFLPKINSNKNLFI